MAFYSDGIIRVAANNAPISAPQGVTEITQAQFEALKPTPKNPEGLLTWLYANNDYLALMNSHGGIVANFQSEVRANRYDLALTLWSQLPVPQSLATALFDPTGPLVQNGYQDLIDFVAANS